ncbi:MAG TPA: NrfD/PsrC family molybdoenzyme membrane anchor subunit, partial [Actinomycetales bacterium]|nr:NrfD/PsrC family molybdoenzyme membrane anchor subunit [Actinomycetales bacterium]
MTELKRPDEEVRRRGSRRRRKGAGEQSMVPEAEFTSYYGRPIVKPSPWEADIPAYMFFGGLAAGSSMLAAGGDLTERPTLRRVGRLASLISLTATLFTLIHDLGRPGRFLNMLRTMKLTSPMSVGTWILSAYGPFAGLAAVSELVDMLPEQGRRGGLLRLASAVGKPAGVVAAVAAPPVAAYTAVLLSDTATPSWHEAHRELPFVFVGSAAAAAGGLGLLAVPKEEAGPAQRMAVGGAVLELAAEQQMERSMGITAEPLHEGTAGRLMRASKALTALGAAGALFSRRSRVAGVVSGAALITGSVCTRFGIFHAGQESAKDPRYTVVPQRERLDRGQPIRY